MKFSAVLAMTAAPLALAKSVRNIYPVRRDPANLARTPEPKGNDGSGSKGSNAGAALTLGGLAGFGITETQLSEVIVIWVNPGAGAATTAINQQKTVTQTVTVAAAAAATQAAQAGTNTVASSASGTVAATGATHSVVVGGAGGLVYTPSEVQAAVGDMVIFTFMSANHTATQSAFNAPCVALAGGMNSGFQPNPNNTVNPPPQVAMQVMVDTPLWFYCAQKGHCGKGMVFSINPTAAKTQAMFQAMAIAQNGTGAGTAITGSGSGAGASNSTLSSSSAAAAAPAPATSVANGAAAAASTAASSAAAAAPTAASSAAAAATSAATAAAASGVVVGTGTTNADGSCACAVVCSAGSFPAVQAQGVGAFGGFGGALPASMIGAA